MRTIAIAIATATATMAPAICLVTAGCGSGSGEGAAPAITATAQVELEYGAQLELLPSGDVIVRDNRGQFVADLKKDEFEVYEDGVKQQMVSFTLTAGADVREVWTRGPARVLGA